MKMNQGRTVPLLNIPRMNTRLFLVMSIYPLVTFVGLVYPQQRSVLVIIMQRKLLFVYLYFNLTVRRNAMVGYSNNNLGILGMPS